MIKAWAKWLLCAALVLAVAASFQPSTGSAAGITYYVSAENGSDSNNGTSLNTAFKTIQKAADMATAGDTVLIGGGVYRETVTPAHSGTSANPSFIKITMKRP